MDSDERAGTMAGNRHRQRALFTSLKVQNLLDSIYVNANAVRGGGISDEHLEGSVPVGRRNGDSVSRLPLIQNPVSSRKPALRSKKNTSADPYRSTRLAIRLVRRESRSHIRVG